MILDGARIFYLFLSKFYTYAKSWVVLVFFKLALHVNFYIYIVPSLICRHQRTSSHLVHMYTYIFCVFICEWTLAY